MATSAVAAKDLTVTTGSGATEITNVDVTEEVDLLDATSNASLGHDEYIEGVDRVTVSATAIGTKPSKGADAALAINSGVNTWTGAAIINRVRTAMPIKGNLAYDFDASYTGEVSVS